MHLCERQYRAKLEREGVTTIHKELILNRSRGKLKFLLGENPLNRSARRILYIERIILIKVGSIYNTNNYGQIKVLSKSDRTDFYMVEFLDTGTKGEYRGYQIQCGCVRDPYAKAVCGVACTGNIKTKGKYKKLYSIWHGIICRCYSKQDTKYKAYRNVTVCDRWLVFANFYYDAVEMDGYDKEKLEEGDLVIDKDIKQRYSLQKIYSPETCIWVDKSVNNSIQDSQQKQFKAVSPNGEIFHDFNITSFARAHHLERRHISGVLHGRAKTTAGWAFVYEEIV